VLVPPGFRRLSLDRELPTRDALTAIAGVGLNLVADSAEMMDVGRRFSTKRANGLRARNSGSGRLHEPPFRYRGVLQRMSTSGTLRSYPAGEASAKALIDRVLRCEFFPAALGSGDFQCRGRASF